MRKSAVLAIGAALVGCATVASADVRLTMRGGRVTLVAKDATIRQILTEWARVGQTKIVNVERVPGGPVTLELTDVPEQQALDVLLRAISGYVAAPRAGATVNASVFDRIIVMPTSVAPSSPASPAPASFAQPTISQRPPMPEDDQGDDRPPTVVPGPNRGPVFVVPPPPATNFPQSPLQPPGVVPNPAQQPPQFFLQGGAPAGFPPPVSYPGQPTAATPAGVAVPGMVVPAPAPPPGQLPPGQLPPGQPQR